MKQLSKSVLTIFLAITPLSFATAQTASGPPVEFQGDWHIWCERTHNDSGTEFVTHNDGAQVFGYFSLKGEAGSYPITKNTCYVRNVDAPGRSLIIDEVYPTGVQSTEPGCNSSYVGKIGASVQPGAGKGYIRRGDTWSFNVGILKNAPCEKPMLWMKPGVINGYIRFKEQFGETEFTLPVTFHVRP